MTKGELVKSLEQYSDNEEVKISVVFDEDYKMIANIESVSNCEYAVSKWVELKGEKIKVMPLI